MSKKVFLLLVAILLAFSFDAFGWKLTQHKTMAEWLLTEGDLPYLLPYVDKFDEIGLDEDNIIYLLWTVEPRPETNGLPHLNWNDVNDQTGTDSFFLLPCDDVNMLLIIHAAEDSGSVHVPGSAVWLSKPEEHHTDAHNAMEYSAYAQGYYDGDPFLSYDNILTGSWSDKMRTYSNDSTIVAQDFQDWYYTQELPLGEGYDTNNDYADVPASYIDAHIRQAMRMTIAALSQYFDYHEFTEPGSTIARWSFNEYGTAPQILVNSKGSIAAHLFLGSTSSSDTHEPAMGTGIQPWESIIPWDSGAGVGGGNSCICPKYLDAVGNTTTDYARNTDTWSQSELDAICPKGSYTVEVVFSVKEYIQSTTDDNRFMGIVTYRDRANPDDHKYLLRLDTYKESTGGTWPTRLRFRSRVVDDSEKSIVLNTTESGITIVPDQWYYAAAIFHCPTSTMDLILRDMKTGQTISTSGNMAAACSMSANPIPDFYIGTQYSGSRGFKGKIDDVRISNRDLVLDCDRLVPSTVAYWKFDIDNVGNPYGDVQHFYNTKGIDLTLQNGSSSGNSTSTS